MTSEQLVNILKDYGADMDGIEERFLSDYELYEICLKKFLKDSSFEALGCAISGKDYLAAFDIAHNLKGVSGNLGLYSIYRMLCKIVVSLRAKEYKALDFQYAVTMSCLLELKALVQS